MAKIVFEEQSLLARVPDFESGGAFSEVPLMYRVDPLSGLSARILTATKLQPSAPPDLSPLMVRGGFCPFCADTIEEATFPFPPEITPEGKVKEGSCLVVPNILAYSSYSAVGVYDPSRHFLGMGDFTPELVTDAFAGMVRYLKAVKSYDPSATYLSINANYMPSSGSSLVHPHLQSSGDSVPLSTQRLVGRACGEFYRKHQVRYFDELLREEMDGPRYVGSTGPVSWITPFAPSGFHEVWGVLLGYRDISDLEQDAIGGLGLGLSRILGAYAEANLSAFNFSLQGGGPFAEEEGSDLRIRIVSRAPIEPYYRSEITYFERLGLEAMIDQFPEEWASKVRAHFP